MQLYKWKIDHPIVIDKWNYCTLLLDFLGLAFYYYWIYLCWTFVRHIISYWTFQLMLVFATCIIALDWLLLDQYVLFWMKSYLISCNLLTLQNQPYFRGVQLIQLNFEANNRVTSAFLLRCFGLFQRERQLFLFYKMGLLQQHDFRRILPNNSVFGQPMGGCHVSDLLEDFSPHLPLDTPHLERTKNENQSIIYFYFSFLSPLSLSTSIIICKRALVLLFSDIVEFLPLVFFLIFWRVFHVKILLSNFFYLLCCLEL